MQPLENLTGDVSDARFNIQDRTLLQIAIPLGYKEDSTGMQRYIQDVSQLMQAHEEVSNKNAEVIRLMVSRGFGVELDASNEISVTQAREYAMKLSQCVSKNAFCSDLACLVPTHHASSSWLTSRLINFASLPRGRLPCAYRI